MIGDAGRSVRNALLGLGPRYDSQALPGAVNGLASGNGYSHRLPERQPESQLPPSTDGDTGPGDTESDEVDDQVPGAHDGSLPSSDPYSASYPASASDPASDSASASAPARAAFELGLATAPVTGVLLLLASTCIPGSVVRGGIVGGVRPYDIMTLFLSFVRPLHPSES